MKRCRQLRNVFGSKDIPLHLKINIYKSAVMSLMTYGCEAWSLTPEIQARINGANSRCLARLTGHTVHQEASARSQTFDLVTAIKIRKWKWLGHILRTPGDHNEPHQPRRVRQPDSHHRWVTLVPVCACIPHDR